MKVKKRILTLRIASLIFNAIAAVLAYCFSSLCSFIIPTIIILSMNIAVIVLEQKNDKATKKENESAAKNPVLTKQTLFRDVPYAPFEQGLELYDKKKYIEAICAFDEALILHHKKNRIKSLFITDYIAPAIHYNLAECYVEMAKSASNPMIKDEHYSKAEGNYLLAKSGFWSIETDNVGKHVDLICSGICVAIAELYNLQGSKEKFVEYEEMAVRVLEQRTGRYSGALVSAARSAVTYEDYRRSLAYWKKLLKLHNIVDVEPELMLTWEQLLEAYIGLADCHFHLGEYREALSTYEWKACPLCEQQYGADDLHTAEIYNNTALVYDNQGDYAKALEGYQKALTICEKVLGTEHPDTATSYNNIATVYYRQGDYAKALEGYQKALAILEKVLGTEHPSTATAYNNIAAVYSRQGDYAKALDWFIKSYGAYCNVLGDAHPGTRETKDYMERTYNRAALSEPFERWLAGRLGEE